MPGLSWIQIGGGAVAAFLLSWLLHTVDVDRLERNFKNDMAKQIAADVLQCNIDKQITREANDALQKDHDIIANRLAALKLQRPKTCVPVTSKAQLSADRPEYAGSYGITSDALREYAADAEGYRSALITCDKFLDAERAK